MGVFTQPIKISDCKANEFLALWPTRSRFDNNRYNCENHAEL